jgi:hypothetical protein
MTKAQYKEEVELIAVAVLTYYPSQRPKALSALLADAPIILKRDVMLAIAMLGTERIKGFDNGLRSI